MHAIVGSCPIYTERSLDELRRGSGDKKLERTAAVTAPSDDPADLTLTLQTKTTQAIVVTGVTVRRLSSAPVPTQGSVVRKECGGLMSPRVFDVDLTAQSIKLGRPAEAATKLSTFRSRCLPAILNS